MGKLKQNNSISCPVFYIIGFCCQEAELASRVAVVIGAAEGGLPWIEANVLKMKRDSPWRISPFCVPGALSNMPAGYVSQLFGCCGPSECLC